MPRISYTLEVNHEGIKFEFEEGAVDWEQFGQQLRYVMVNWIANHDGVYNVDDEGGLFTMKNTDADPDQVLTSFSPLN